MQSGLIESGMNPAEFANIAAVERDLWWYRGMERTFYRFVEPLVRNRTNLRVLEAGCGTGFMSRSMRQRLDWSMFPMDLSLVGLAHARRLGLDRLAAANIVQLPYRDASFDAVVSLDVIAHLEPGPDEEAFVEFARVLRPGGFLFLRSSALPVLRSRHSMFVQERQRYTKTRLRHLCRKAGLEVRRLTYLNSFLLPVAFLKFRLWEPLMAARPASGVTMPPPWLNRLLELPLRVESALVGAKVNLPLGQSLLLAAAKPARVPERHGG